MEIRLAVLADAANTSSEGKLNILGEFNVIWSSVFPFVWPRFFVVVKVEFSTGDPHQISTVMKMIDPDGKKLQEATGVLNRGKGFAEGNAGSAPLIVEVCNALIPREGDYVFEVTLDHITTRIPLYVIRAQVEPRIG